MSGIDTLRGIAFQLAQTLVDVIDLVLDDEADAVVIEGAQDIVDYEVLDRGGRRIAVRQAKTRREPGTWGASELAAILCTWGDLPDAADAEFVFVTDASLNGAGLKLSRLIEDMREHPDEAVLQERAAALGRGGVRLPSLDVLRRVEIRTRAGSTDDIIARVEMSILNLLSHSRIATLDDAANAANALYRRLFVLGGHVELARRTISRQDILDALGLAETDLRSGVAWSDATAQAYRDAVIATSHHSPVFVRLNVDAVASTPHVLRLLQPTAAQEGHSQPPEAILEESAVALIGATGQGKTTTLTQVASIAAQRGLIPVIIPAAGHTAGALPRRLRHAVQTRLDQSLTAGAAQTLLASPALLVLIDGISEVDPDTHAALCADLRQLAAQRPLRLIATGRDLPLTLAATSVVHHTPAVYQLAPLDRHTRRHLASACAVDGNTVATIEQRLGNAVNNPMLFLMALSVSDNGVPATRAEVYQQFLHGLAARAHLRDDDLHSAAIATAWAALIAAGRRNADHYAWQSTLGTVLPDLHALPVWQGQSVTPAAALAYAQAMGLLTRLDADSGLIPLHDSFADYLAARAIVRGHAHLPATLDPAHDEIVLFTVDMVGLDHVLAERLAVENPLLACRVAESPRAHGTADPDEVGRLLELLAAGCALPLLDASVGLRLHHHINFTGVVLAGGGYDAVDAVEFASLAQGHPAMMLPAQSSSLQLAINVWVTAVRRAQRPAVRVFQPPPPTDPDAATGVLLDYLRAVQAELRRLVTNTLPQSVGDRVLTALGPQGMVAYVHDAQPGPLGGVDVPVQHRRADHDRVTRFVGHHLGDDPSLLEHTTLARLMVRHPTHQAAVKIAETLTTLTEGTWPTP